MIGLVNAKKIFLSTLLMCLYLISNSQTSSDVIPTGGAEFDQSFSVFTEIDLPTDLAFSSDGMKLFVIGEVNDIRVAQYSLNTAFDIEGGVTFDGNSIDLNTEDANPRGFAFSSNGSKMFMVGNSNDAIFQYSLANPFDVTSGLSYDEISLNVSSQGTFPSDIHFNLNGTKMYITDIFDDEINQYTLDNPFDISSGVSFDENPFSVGEGPSGLAFNSDGTRLLVIDLVLDYINEYSLSVPYDITSNVNIISTFGTFSEGQSPTGIVVNHINGKMFTTDADRANVNQYTVNVDPASIGYLVFTTTGAIAIDEDFVNSQTLTLTQGSVPPDVEDLTIAYSINPTSVDFASMTFNNETGETIFESITDGSGVQTFSITADNGQESSTYSQTFTVTINPVNDEPSFETSGNITVDEDFVDVQTLTVTQGSVPQDEEGQTTTYSINPTSVDFASMTFNSQTGETSFESISNSNGVQAFTITADDGQETNNTYSQTFTLTINPVNDKPSFETSGNIIVDEDFVDPQIVTATQVSLPQDEEDQTITYSINPTSVDFASIIFNDQTGEVSFESISNGNGVQAFTITADDGQETNSTYSQVFTLTINPVNEEPTFETSGDITVDEDFVTPQTLTVTSGPVLPEEEGQTIIYSINPTSVGFASMTFNDQTGEISFESISNSNGVQAFTITADDGQEANNTYSQTFTLTINPVNDKPSFETIGDITVDEDFVGSQILTVTQGSLPQDEEDQTITYSILPTTVDFASMTFNDQTGETSFESISNSNGVQAFTITADDGQETNSTHSETFTLTINPVNDEPSFETSNDITVDEDFVDYKTLTVTQGSLPQDEEDQTITYSILPTNVDFASMTFNDQTGEASFESISNSNGVQAFTITAGDGQETNSAFSQSFILTVNPVNDEPTIEELLEQEMDTSESLSIDIDVFDPDGDDITISAISSQQDVIKNEDLIIEEIDNKSFNLQINPSSDVSGRTSIILKIEDGHTTVEKSFDLVVLSPITSISENDKDDYQIFPNPSSEYIKIKLLNKSNDIVGCYISTIKGQFHTSPVIKKSKTEIIVDIEQLNQGIYLLHIVRANGTEVKRFLKEN